MFFNAKEFRAESDKFVSKNKLTQETFSGRSQQQQAQMDEFTGSAIAQVRMRQEQQRRAELTSAFDLFRDGVGGLVQNVANISFLSSNDGSIQSLEAQNSVHEELGEVIFASPVGQSLQSKFASNISKEQIIDLMLQEDQELQNLDQKIRILQDKKNNMCLEDTSKKAYDFWCQAEVNSALMAAGEVDLVAEMRKAKAKLCPYDEWKAPMELLNQKKLVSAEEEIVAVKKLYALEIIAAREALGNYELSRIRYEKQLLNSTLSLEQVNLYMKRFPAPLEFEIATLHKHSVTQAKIIDHPQAAGLVALLLNGSSATNDSWRNMQNFYKHPLPGDCFDSNITVGGDLAKRIQQQADIHDNPALKMLIKGGKTVWNGAVKGPFMLRIGGTLVFEGLDVCIGENDPDRTKINRLKERLDRSLDVCKQIIPRVAGTNQQLLKCMYSALNAALRAVVDDPNSSSQVKRLLQERIDSNYNSLMHQRQDIQDYLAGAPCDYQANKYKKMEW